MVGVVLNNFQLNYWWLLPALLLAGAFIIGGLVFYRSTSRKRAQSDKTVLVANSYRVRNTQAYQAALKKLWFRVIVAAVLVSFAGALAAFGAARPITVAVEHPQKHNRDIVLCLDASGSMFDVDIDILRKFDQLADGFKGERVGLTLFNATSMQVFPLTDDYDYVKQNLAKVEKVFRDSAKNPEASSYLAPTLGRKEGASLVGDGLYGCSLSFDYKQDESRSRSIILATDNVVNGTELVPFDEAAQQAKKANIRVYGINPGSRGLGVSFVPESSIKSMETNVEVTGGKFFLLNNTSAVTTIVDEIAATETTLAEGSPMILKHDDPVLILYLIAGIMLIGFSYAVWRKV